MMRSIVPLCVLSVLFITVSCNGQQVHQATGAGFWYPAGQEALAAAVDQYLSEKPEKLPTGQPVAIIAPHAGYRFSGACAGAAFSAVKGRKYDRVIVLGISHRVPFAGAVVLKADAYETPLGRIEIDSAACKDLLEHELFKENAAAFDGEHSLENELPFLQRALAGPFKLVPVLVGLADADQASEIAGRIRPLMAGQTLMVVSSDFTHHGRDYNYVRFTTGLQANLKALAMAAATEITELDDQGLRKHIEDTGDTICGRNAISVLLHTLPPGSKGEVAKFQTSGELLGDYTNSVSYLSIVFAQGDDMISPDGQAILLDIARKVIEGGVRREKRPVFEVEAPELQQNQGAFVTITTNGKLRGCIGLFTADQPLHKVVRDMAHAAAFEDSRFTYNRLKPDDIANMKIEISVLSPMKRVREPLKEVEVGKHGIYVVRGNRHGTFLPQVAIDHDMDLETFLSTCCAHKAGLSPDAWKDPQTEVYVYSAQVFGEK